jgi:predicted nucleotidyltransferase
MVEYSDSVIREICKKYNLTSFALFGSAVSDEFREQSDVDVLVSFDSSKEMNYFNAYFDLKLELENYWHRAVDVVVEKEFRNHYFRDSVEKQKVVIYER